MPKSNAPRKAKPALKKPKDHSHRLTMREELLAIDGACSATLIGHERFINNVVGAAKTKAEQENGYVPDEVVEIATIAKRDLRTLYNELLDIRKNIPMETRRSNVDHKLIALTVNNQYQDWMFKVEGAVVPNVKRLSELTGVGVEQTELVKAAYTPEEERTEEQQSVVEDLLSQGN